MSNEFEILTETRDYLVAEANEETYIIEDSGFSENAEAYVLEVGDSDTVYTEDNNFNSPSTIRILESEAKNLTTNEDLVEKVLDKAGVIDSQYESVVGQGEFGLGGF